MFLWYCKFKLPSHPQGQNHSQQTLLQVQAKTERWAETKNRWSVTANRAQSIRHYSNYVLTGQLCVHIHGDWQVFPGDQPCRYRIKLPTFWRISVSIMINTSQSMSHIITFPHQGYRSSLQNVWLTWLRSHVMF